MWYIWDAPWCDICMTSDLYAQAIVLISPKNTGITLGACSTTCRRIIMSGAGHTIVIHNTNGLPYIINDSFDVQFRYAYCFMAQSCAL